MAGGKPGDEFNSQMHSVDDLLGRTPPKEYPDKPSPIADSDDTRPASELTTLAFKIALDNMYRAVSANSRVQMQLLDVIAGVKDRTHIDRKTLAVLEKTLDELTGLRAVAYAGEASMVVITEVRDELRLIRLAAYASAADVHEMRESAASAGAELTTIRQLLTAALVSAH